MVKLVTVSASPLASVSLVSTLPLAGLSSLSVTASLTAAGALLTGKTLFIELSTRSELLPMLAVLLK